MSEKADVEVHNDAHLEKVDYPTSCRFDTFAETVIIGPTGRDQDREGQ